VAFDQNQNWRPSVTCSTTTIIMHYFTQYSSFQSQLYQIHWSCQRQKCNL